MTVAELIAELSKLDPDALVILSSDAEGNNYRQADELAAGTYSRRDEEFNWMGKPAPDDVVACVTLWPVD